MNKYKRPKTYIFQKKQLNTIIRNALKSAQNGGKEICGLMVDNGFFIEIIQTKNKSKVGGSFSFYVSEIRAIVKAAKRLNHEIIGTFHSHPLWLAEPGDSDISNAVDDSLMLIIDCLDKNSKLWHIKKNKAKEKRMELI